jgi:hypothetical protein
MNKSRLRELVEEFSSEVKNEELHASTAELTKQLTQDVHQYLATSVTPTTRTQTLEIEYAQSHPRIRGIVSEIVDILSKMGI